jgi:predicted metal-dependent hydrolase
LAGIEEFNTGAFYECHETLEDLWMAEARPLRSLYQGILQIGVAFYHLRAERHRGAEVLLKRGMGHLRPFAPHCLGVDVAALLERAAGCLVEVQRLGPDRLREFDWSLIPVIDVQSSL